MSARQGSKFVRIHKHLAERGIPPKHLKKFSVAMVKLKFFVVNMRTVESRQTAWNEHTDGGPNRHWVLALRNRPIPRQDQVNCA